MNPLLQAKSCQGVPNILLNLGQTCNHPLLSSLYSSSHPPIFPAPLRTHLPPSSLLPTRPLTSSTALKHPQDSGNKVSRRSAITGTANITLGGRTVIQADVHLRGDLHPTRAMPRSDSSGREVIPTSISIGRCTVISTGSVIKPPSRVSRGQVHYYPMKIGDNVFVGPNCSISAISIASHVHIGVNTTIHPFVIIKENVKILPNTVIPTQMVIPSGSVVGGRPARVVGEVGEGWGVSAGGAGGGGLGVGGGGEKNWVEGGDLRELVRSIK
ncbi:trimeric LpxA-like protein [Zopfia rhizophila CBS 207.26]|uniref:Dynactin subunit 5 n=1 Tax=Zopfia rhizophila CBS 207.26 TaxID=1314779 RepID=A0A6A6DVP2_9PEZI|nr:trimeric LpxA-like protein [Zopfia rhizophila CBS 207.26]